MDKSTMGHHRSTKYDPPISTTQALIEIAEKHISSDVSGGADVWMLHSTVADKIIGQLLFELDAAICDSCYLSQLFDENKTLKETVEDLERQNEEMENDITARNLGA